MTNERPGRRAVTNDELSEWRMTNDDLGMVNDVFMGVYGF